CSWYRKKHKNEEFPELFEHMNQEHWKDKGIAMVSINKDDTQWMPRVTRDVGLELVMVATRVEAIRAKEMPQQKNLVSMEEVVHGKYPDPAHQKE
ncbi:hypothetical protein KI387_014935, partial [Taxus chinensis]